MGEPAHTNPADALPGRVIADRFRITRVIARGGMGRVYEAEQVPLGRKVALKILDARYQDDSEAAFQKRFFLEASSLAKLSHPNTVTVFDYGRTEDGIFYIAMEYVEGRTLHALLREAAPLPPERALAIAIQIARSLREAHSHGIIHRDLKPANVMIRRHGDQDDFVTVLDFGLVKNLGPGHDDEVTGDGLFMGSPKYMSPEQVRGATMDMRSDVYSLGIVLYEMLTGRVPFSGATSVDTLMAHVKMPPPPMSTSAHSVDSRLEAVVAACLAKDPASRWASMDALLTELHELNQELGGSPDTNPIVRSSAVPTSSDRRPSGVREREIARPSETTLSMAPVIAERETLAPAQTTFTRRRSTAWLIASMIIIGAAGGIGAAVALHESEDVPQLATSPRTVTEAAQPAPDTEPEPVEVAPTPVEPPIEILSLRVHVTSTPPGAEIFVGDQSYGMTPAEIEWLDDLAAPGRVVQFRFELPGHRSTTIDETIGEGAELRVHARLPYVRRVAPRESNAGSGEGPSGGAIELPGGYRESPY